MLGQAVNTPEAKKRRRTLRKAMTEVERTLWRRLRGRQVAGMKFRCQHPFGKYILDFVCLEKKVVVETDGGQHAEQVGYDAKWTATLAAAGFRVLRFWNNDVLQQTDAVVAKIYEAVTEPHPHPYPPLEGEGVQEDEGRD